MHPLLYSSFLQALGYAIINSLWQFAFLWLLYFAINMVFKVSSHQKYITGLVLEFAGFVWFLETLKFYYKQYLLLAPNTSVVHQAYLSSVTSNGGTIKQQFFILVLRSEQFFPYLSIAYLALLFILAVRWMYAYTYTQKVRTHGLRKIEIPWQAFVQRLSVQLGIKRTVNILLSELVQTPMTIGFIKPLILIPVATINYLTPQQLEAVILHELAHIKRFDYFFNLLLAFIETCLFFNPFMQLIHHQIKKERENCCDDWVIKYKYSAHCYAGALLQIASHQTKLPLLAMKAIDNRKLLINRIKRIVEKNERPFFNYKHQLLALMVITTVLSTLSILAPSKKVIPSGSPVRPNTMFEPIAAKVNNPLFNPLFFLSDTSKMAEQKKKSEESKAVKTGVRLNRLPAPAEPSIPLEPDLFVQDENDVIIEQTPDNALTQLVPVTTPNEAQTSGRFFEGVNRNPQSFEKHLQRFNWDSFKGKTDEMEKVKSQLKKALGQIKMVWENGDFIKLQGLVRTGIRKLQKGKPDITISGAEDKLELLEKQLERVIDSIELPQFYTPALNSDLNINFQLPAVVYTFSPPKEQHAFSYEFSAKPQVRIINPPSSTDCLKLKKQKEKVVVNDDEDEIKQDEIAAPHVAPARFRSVYVIKI